MFNRVLTTMDCHDEDVMEDGVIMRVKGSLKEYQTVLAVGESVRGVKEGDIVCVNPTRYAVMKHNEGSLKNGVITDNPVIGYKFQTVKVGGRDCLMLYDQDIDFVVLETE